MNTNEIKAVVDMVSDKISGGIQAVQPLAEEAVRQYQARAYFCAWLGGCVAVLGLVSLVISFLAFQEDNEGAGIPTLILGLVALIIGVTLNAANYIAPLCGLIGK
jgi:tetrahydromethanopterin S-methyltransferase subunit E